MRILISSIIISLVFGSMFPSLLFAFTKQDQYVRTANYFLRSGPVLDQALNDLASYDLLVLPAEAQVYNESFFRNIRKLNPDIVILAYVPTVSFNNAYWDDPLHKILKNGIQSSWWLRDGTTRIKSIWPNTSALNINSGWTNYLANFVKTEVLSTGLWDGIFFDEVNDSISWVTPIDTNQDGETDSAEEADQNWKNAYIELFSKTRELVGDTPILITNGSSNPLFQPYLNGRMFESFPTPWESSNSWSSVTQRYLDLEKEVGYDPIFILNADSNNTGNQNDYQKVRFGITTTLLGNGYFGYDFGTENHAQIWYYDEYDAILGEPKGSPEDLLVTTNNRITPSVWERDFVQGKVLVNSTSSAQTIRLDGEYEKMHGTQDPSVNNGSIITRVVLNALDGLILFRPIEKINKAVFVNGAFARIFQNNGQAKRTGFFAYESAHQGGQQIIFYDIDLDGKDETIVANHTQVFIYDDDGSLHASFYPYTENFELGINLAVGDIENDGSVEIVTGTEDGGGPQIRIFNKDGNLIHPGFFAYADSFRGGVNVAIGDLNGDNINEIIAGAGVGGGPHVRVFNKDGDVINPGFFAYDEQFRGGVNVAVGDVDGDGIDDIVTGPGLGGSPRIRVYDKDGNLSTQFFAFDSSETNGVEVTVSDLDGDNIDEIIGMSREVFTFSFK